MRSDSVGIACVYRKAGGGFRSHVAGRYVTKDKDEDDFDWAGFCDKDAAGWLLLLSEEGCSSLSVQAGAVFEEVHLSQLISA